VRAALNGVETILDHIKYRPASTQTTPDACISHEPTALAHVPRTGVDENSIPSTDGATTVSMNTSVRPRPHEWVCATGDESAFCMHTGLPVRWADVDL
jgi:hypothetical protein